MIGDRKWKEVISAFQFPSTITSASFVLRKYYLSLLHSYEQIYFLQTQLTKQPIFSASTGQSHCLLRIFNSHILTKSLSKTLLDLSTDDSSTVRTQSHLRTKKQPEVIKVVPAPAAAADHLANNSSDLPSEHLSG